MHDAIVNHRRFPYGNAPATETEIAPVTEFLTTREVADLLRLKERKIYELAKANAIPVSRATGKLLFPRDLVESWVRRNTEYADGVESLAERPQVVAGSNDPLLDWALRESGAGLASYFDGSLDGLQRMAGGEAIAAGIHIPEDDGGFNVIHVRDAMPGRPVVVMEWAKRSQGLVLAPELEGVTGLRDLRGKRIVPRQGTAGSRLLLDQLMLREGLTDNDVTLVDPPARDHADVAQAISDGKADAGLAVEAAARRMRLPFVPIAVERYDLAIWHHDFFAPPMQSLFGFARGDAFAAKAADLGGYDITDLGRVHYNGG